MAKPNLAYIPATIGDKVYSILPSDGVGDFDFDRADGSSPTGVTRINAQGLIEQVASGVNRLNYSLLDGEVVGCPHLLLENSATNLVQYSEDFSQSVWVKSNTSITANQIVSPDGTLNADLLTSSSGSSTHSVRNDTSQTVTVGENITLSVFAKKGTYSIIQLTAFAFGSIYANFDLQNGVVGSYNSTNASIENFGNGWYRCSFTATAVGTTNSEIQINIVENLQSVRNSSFNAVGNETVYLWGGQSEVGSYLTSYIKTTSAAVTRAAETCNGSGDAATFNDSEGVLMAEISALDNDSENKFISISNGSNTETLRIAYISGTDIRLETSMTSGTNFQKDIEINLSDNNKVCFQYKSNEYKVFVNGFSYSVTQRLTTPTGLNELSFHRGDGERNFYGKTKQLQYFDSALSDTELEQLTSWDSFRAMAQAQLYSVE